MNKDTQSFGQTIVKADASTAYIAIDFVKQYSDFQYNYYTDPNRVVLTNAWGDYTIASAKQKQKSVIKAVSKVRFLQKQIKIPSSLF